MQKRHANFKAFIFLMIFFSGASFWACTSGKKSFGLESPNGQLKLVVTIENQQLYYEVLAVTDSNSVIVVNKSPLGLVRSDGDFSTGLTLKAVSEPKTITERYDMIVGKERRPRYTASETSVRLLNSRQQEMDLVFRVFDEGVAFRYVFPGTSAEKYTIEQEITGFSVANGCDAWLSPYQKAQNWGDPGYEADYLAAKAGTASPGKEGWAFPLLFNAGSHWLYISEAGTGPNYCATHLSQDCSGGLYRISLPEADERHGDGTIHPSSALPWTMPWRFILVGTSLAPVVESSMVYHLAEPCKLNDTAWIKPGRASWEWWSSKGGRTVQALKHFIDLAAEMGWEYSLIDAGWEKMPDGKIEEVIDYASKKNIGLLFWYNSGGRRDSTAGNEDFVMFNRDTREREMERIEALGVKGIKVDFFATDKQMALEEYFGILDDAARHHLLVNFHGCTLPRGWSRTYPNLLAMEAVRGAECYRFSEAYPAYASTYNTIAAISRTAAGPTDYTPVTFSKQKFPHLTTAAHELALTLVYETGLLHLADTPESYRSQPAGVIDFLKHVPITWDETRLIQAVPGDVFVIARRNGEKWRVAGINGNQGIKEIQIKLPFALESPLLISDDPEAAEPGLVRMQGSVTSLTVKMMPHGGFVLF